MTNQEIEFAPDGDPEDEPTPVNEESKLEQDAEERFDADEFVADGMTDEANVDPDEGEASPGDLHKIAGFSRG
jgi:hypothetical protein